MNYKKVLTKLGLIEGVDFALTETSFETLEQTRQVLVGTIHHDAIPAVIDEDEITVGVSLNSGEPVNFSKVIITKIS